MTDTAPRVGDKVVYVPDPGRPQHEAWRERAERPSLVVAAPDEDGYLTCLPLWESEEGIQAWCAPPRRLRVVERATYEVVSGG